MISYIDERPRIRSTASYISLTHLLDTFLNFIRDWQLPCLPIVFVTLLRSRGNARNSKFRECRNALFGYSFNELIRGNWNDSVLLQQD